MKEASGELNMTLITIIAVSIIGAIFYALWPTIKNSINKQWNTAENAGSGEYNKAAQRK